VQHWEEDAVMDEGAEVEDEPEPTTAPANPALNARVPGASSVGRTRRRSAASRAPATAPLEAVGSATPDRPPSGSVASPAPIPIAAANLTAANLAANAVTGVGTPMRAPDNLSTAGVAIVTAPALAAAAPASIVLGDSSADGGTAAGNQCAMFEAILNRQYNTGQKKRILRERIGRPGEDAKLAQDELTLFEDAERISDESQVLALGQEILNEKVRRLSKVISYWPFHCREAFLTKLSLLRAAPLVDGTSDNWQAYLDPVIPFTRAISDLSEEPEAVDSALEESFDVDSPTTRSSCETVDHQAKVFEVAISVQLLGPMVRTMDVGRAPFLFARCFRLGMNL